MNNEKRALLAGILSFLAFLGWYYFYGSRIQPSPPPTQPTAPAPSEPPSGASLSQKGLTTPVSPEMRTRLETEKAIWEVGSHGGMIKRAILKGYQQGVDKKSPPIDLLLSDEDRGLALDCLGCNFSLPQEGRYHLAAQDEKALVYEAEKGGLRVRKLYHFDGYTVQMKLVLENRSPAPLAGRVGLVWRGRQKPEGKGGLLKGPPDQRQFLYQSSGRLGRPGRKEEVKEVVGPTAWAAIEDRYFLIALVARRLSSEGNLRMVREPGWVTMTFSPSQLSVPAGGLYEEVYTIYMGPKEREALKETGVGLEKAVDYGWFSFLAIPILKLLLIFHSLVKNWGIAIILLTIIVKLLLNPLSVKALKQMKGMQALQPRLAELKERYKNDRQRLNLETMQLFKNHKVNPMGGCLPMLIQMPIYIALYKVLYNAIELYHAPFFGIYRDLSAADPYFILPILLGVFMFLQQKMTPSASVDPAQRQMMMIMPVMFTAFMLFLPLGLVLYILVNTVMGVVQQYLFQHDLRLRDLLKTSTR